MQHHSRWIEQWPDSKQKIHVVFFSFSLQTMKREKKRNKDNVKMQNTKEELSLYIDIVVKQYININSETVYICVSIFTFFFWKMKFLNEQIYA